MRPRTYPLVDISEYEKATQQRDQRIQVAFQGGGLLRVACVPPVLATASNIHQNPS
jgi:hypothetical protein